MRSVPLRLCVFLPISRVADTAGPGPAADGDRYEAWERHPREFSCVPCQSRLPALHHTAILTYLLCARMFSLFFPRFNQNILSLVLFPREALDYIKVAVLLVQASNKLMSGCCRLINVSWCVCCLHAKKSLHISFSSSPKIDSLLLEWRIPDSVLWDCSCKPFVSFSALDLNMAHLT